MSFNGVAFGLPFAMNSVEGSEASMFVAAAASRSSWRKAMIALGAAVVTLVPFAVILWAAFHFVGAQYLDYTIAFLVFVLGAREVREGLTERPRKGRIAPGQVERVGLAPASAESIRAFQRRHGLPVSGVIDEQTRTALRAARAEAGYSEVDPYLLGVDVADADAVRAFQRRHGLSDSGNVDAATRGALRVAQQQGFLDTLDTAAIRRFQREHDLPDTGDVDEATAVALGTVRGEGATQAGQRRLDAAVAWTELDPADGSSIRALQRTLGLPADGLIGPETRGALLALRARLHPDPVDPGSVRALQARAGLAVTGVIDEATRRVIREQLPEVLRPRPAGAVPDPVDPEAVRTFQRLYGLDGTGTIDTDTQRAIRYARDYYCDIDPADERSIARFQAAHGITATGVIGPDTQTALLTVRTERMPAEDKQRRRRYGPMVDGADPLLDVDIADPDAVRAFQRRHHLSPDGIVGPRTREAFAVARQARLAGEPRVGAHDQQRAHGPIARLRAVLGDAWPAYVGVMLETSEALLYSFAVTSSSSSYGFVAPIVGAGIGFSWPWAFLPLVRKLTNNVAEWKQETVIGLILVSVAAAFGLLHMEGVFG